MNWTGFENVIALELRDRYESIKDNLQKADFLSGIYAAKNEMLKLNSGGNVDYCLPFMGEAYAIYYHMQRTDNIFLALTRINKSRTISSNLKVLDIGSGTGSGATAVCYFLSQISEVSPRQTVTVYGVERAEPMSKMAGTLIHHLRRQMKMHSLNLLYYQLSNTQLAVDRLGDGKFDLIIFSYTFDIYDSDDQPKVMSKVLELTKKLRQDGIALLITPKPNSAKVVAAKASFTQDVVSFLQTNGMVSKSIPIGRGVYSGSEKRSAILKTVCDFFNNECQRLGLPLIYVKGDDFPWYGFYAECNLLSWRY